MVFFIEPRWVIFEIGIEHWKARLLAEPWETIDKYQYYATYNKQKRRPNDKIQLYEYIIASPRGCSGNFYNFTGSEKKRNMFDWPYGYFCNRVLPLQII